MSCRTICLHGVESSGKTTLAAALGTRFDAEVVPEYGRIWCEAHGTDTSMADLVEIARTHAAMTRAAIERCDGVLILDTDPLMTAAWAEMLHGARDPWFDRFADYADLYLMMTPDLPWVDDGLRLFPDAVRQRRFHAIAEAELVRRGVRYATVGGATRAARLDEALRAIAAGR